MSSRRSMPLVYASQAAIKHAEKLLPRGAILERLVAEAIERGDVAANDRLGRAFVDEHGVVAILERRPAKVRTSGPRAWWVMRVEPNRNANRRRSRADDKIA